MATALGRRATRKASICSGKSHTFGNNDMTMIDEINSTVNEIKYNINV
jgi:hypothetical protein